ncbi:DUF1983 domain-containing protein [Mangrovibacter sp. SLW1]
MVCYWQYCQGSKRPTPSNLSVTRKGTTNNGLTVVMDWDASIDPNLLGYYTYYRQTGSTTWLVAGQTSKYVTEYELYGLNQSISYDFAVAAYNNLGFVSDKVSQEGVVPDYNFTMPEVTNLHLVNNDYGNTQTEQTDFIIGWDAPTGNVNGKPFSSYFKQYEIVVRDSQGTQLNSYYTTSTTWTYTYAMNQNDGLNRQRTFGIIVHGHSASDYSSEVQVTVSNPQAPLIQNVQMISAIGQIAFTYDSDNFPDDFAGVLFQVSSSSDFSIGVTNFTTTQYYTYFASIDDGQYYVRVGMYDKFGMDNINWSAITPFNQQTSVPFSQLNNDVVDGILSSSEFNTVKEQIIDEAGYTGWTVSVNNNNYVSGIALANSGTESVFTVVADRFSVIDSATAASTNKIYPFVVQNGVSYINGAVIQSASIGSAAIGTGVINNAHIADASISTAKIQDASISTAKIANTIQSTNYSSGSAGWIINKSGSCQFNDVTVRGAVYASSGSFTGNVYAQDGYFNGTVYANKISGNIVNAYALGGVDHTCTQGELGTSLQFYSKVNVVLGESFATTVAVPCCTIYNTTDQYNDQLIAEILIGGTVVAANYLMGLEHITLTGSRTFPAGTTNQEVRIRIRGIPNGKGYQMTMSACQVLVFKTDSTNFSSGTNNGTASY